MNKPFASKALKVVKVGNSTGLILPKELLAQLGVELGDNLYVVRTSDGLELRPHDPEFEKQMSALRTVMKERRAALRELAR